MGARMKAILGFLSALALLAVLNQSVESAPMPDSDRPSGESLDPQHSKAGIGDIDDFGGPEWRCHNLFLPADLDQCKRFSRCLEEARRRMKTYCSGWDYVLNLFGCVGLEKMQQGFDDIVNGICKEILADPSPRSD